MFYQMITNARNRWFASSECTAQGIIAYIEKANQMRDAQIDAIKTYLYLKIACGCAPLAKLFCQGAFNTLDLEQEELSAKTRTFLLRHPAAAALFEYACLKTDSGEQVSEKLEKQIRKDPESIDYEDFFQSAFYGVSYTDYLFSLPMGAGKTYLMAAFIYLDLYFAKNEPHNPAFAHNFMIFAPSGLKSSVVPSLKTIQRFDPSWVIPQPAASEIKRQISFEVLDQGKTANKSNKTKNPNVQKIANHQPLSELFGLVAVTNAEKVILDRIQEKLGQISMFEESDDEKDRQANELRNLIGKLPGLSIFIDEVHHAVSDEIKLRAVVSKWAKNQTVNSVVGFSGTPYLEKAEKIKVTDGLSVSSAEISNIVYYYPLIDGVGNFLKRPIVKIADIPDSSRIIENGVRDFLDAYQDTVYPGGTLAKLGIYCGTIEKLEEMVYPIVARIAAEYGLSGDAILKFHKGNKQYPQPADSQMEFDSLDQPFSKIRIVLLVQIGKEGWDCRSLTGIILSQEGDCPKNMVLQTACRCLRQVQKDALETALIYLNSSNAEKLNAQLLKQHHNFLDFLSCCVALVNAYSEQEKDIKQWLKTTILDSLDDCQINYELLSDADGIFIFPKGAKELDDALVSEPLDWLKEYPQARIAFTKALKEYSEATTTNASDIADKFRKALETFFQEFFGGGRSLEKYVTDHTYEQYLNQRGIPTELRDEFKNTVTAYYKFINNNAKHHDRTEVNILEYLMYQTGNIIRLLITLKQEEEQNAD